MKVIIIILCVVIIFILSCSQGYIVNMNGKTLYPEGRDLFVSKCNACHQLYNPNMLTKAEWDSILVSMKKKSKISELQKNEIYKWILEVKDNNLLLQRNTFPDSMKNQNNHNILEK